MGKEFVIRIVLLALISLRLHTLLAQTSSTVVKKGSKYDTIIRKHVDKPIVKQTAKQAAPEIVLPVPEFVNQPYFYDKDGNKLIRLESNSAELVTKKKTLGLKGAKQMFSMDDVSAKVRFTSKPNIVFFIKTGGDVIDLTSYIKLYKFISEDQKRVVTVTSKEGLLNNNEEEKGKQISFSVKSISNDNYMIQFADTLEAGEYGFVWVKNMDLKEFTVFTFGIDWKSSN
ncbi:MAG TPA: hypothetical protein VGI82_10150 [Chitinophagaceae bacterium]|jgi:hypothetical protein